jgi:hypothetical protein
MNEVCNKFDTIKLSKSQSFLEIFPRFSVFGIQIQNFLYPRVGTRPVSDGKVNPDLNSKKIK